MYASELIEILESLDPDAEIRLAQQPSWPFEYSVSAAVTTDDLPTDDASPDEENVVWVVEGEQRRYLPGYVAAAAWHRDEYENSVPRLSDFR